MNIRIKAWFVINELRQGNTPIFDVGVYAAVAAILLLFLGTGCIGWEIGTDIADTLHKKAEVCRGW